MTVGTLGIIGYGNMGSAIAQGLVKAGTYMPSDIHVYDIDEEKLNRAKESGYFVHASIDEYVDIAKTIIIAVKPSHVAEILEQLRDVPPQTLFISIAAGISIHAIESVLTEAPVIRVMPNTPGMVGAGVSAIAKGTHADETHIDQAKAIMGAIGFVHEIPEEYMDAVTGLSGSGPAYIAIIIEALSDGGVKMGLPRALALKLAAQTVFGTAKMILEKRIHPAVLRDMVASPGGTTIEGITVLEENGVRAAFINAVEMATLKSEELGS